MGHNLSRTLSPLFLPNTPIFLPPCSILQHRWMPLAQLYVRSAPAPARCGGGRPLARRSGDSTGRASSSRTQCEGDSTYGRWGRRAHPWPREAAPVKLASGRRVAVDLPTDKVPIAACRLNWSFGCRSRWGNPVSPPLAGADPQWAVPELLPQRLTRALSMGGGDEGWVPEEMLPCMVQTFLVLLLCLVLLQSQDSQLLLDIHFCLPMVWCMLPWTSHIQIGKLQKQLVCTAC
jgi:hypothetical protein